MRQVRFLLPLLMSVALPLAATAGVGMFDVEKRRSELKTPAYAAAREACMAKKIKLDKPPKPIDGLKETEGYGSDNRAEGFSWVIMVLSGRSLAGDAASTKQLGDLLLQWAENDALEDTQKIHDAYYALKRLLMPTITAYLIVKPSYSEDDAETVQEWIDGLVRKVDQKFDGDVDHNNHRYLADNVLMYWGAIIDDNALYQKGVERYNEALNQEQPDGGLPLETRRGSRAGWYMRQSLANLGLIAEIARLKGQNLFALQKDGKDYDRILSYYLSLIRTPLVVIPDAAGNYKPGPEPDFMKQDFGMLAPRPHGRHYMGFAEMLLASYPRNFTYERLKSLMDTRIVKDRPLIDEFAGGNATCFWWKP